MVDMRVHMDHTYITMFLYRVVVTDVEACIMYILQNATLCLHTRSYAC